MGTSNPTLSLALLEKQAVNSITSDVMTINGVVNKSLILLGLLILSAGSVWSLGGGLGAGLAMIGAIAGLILALVITFKPTTSHIAAPFYAVCEGLFIGGISSMFELRYPGLVMQASSLTFGVLFGLLFAYKSGWIRATENFKRGVIAATLGIGIVYFASMILSLFHIPIGFITGGGIIGIGFSLVVVVIAALNLVLDFDRIEQFTRQGAPQYMEWYSAFALMVTLVWLYLEMLRLLAKLRDSRN